MKCFYPIVYNTKYNEKLKHIIFIYIQVLNISPVNAEGNFAELVLSNN